MERHPLLRLRQERRGVGIWTGANRRSATPTTTTTAGAKGRVFVSTFADCAADLIAVSMQNVAHGWPGADPAGINGTAQAVAFFEAHPRR